MTASHPQRPRSTTDAILDAALELHQQEQPITREAVAQLTGLKMTVVDDRLSTLVDNGQLMRVQRGIYLPAPVYEDARAISRTLLPDGRSKIEIGDCLLTLTPKEERMLASLLAGPLAQVTAIEAGRCVTILTADLAREVAHLRQKMTALKKPVASAQCDWIG